MDGDQKAASAHYQTAVARTTSVAERGYLLTRAARLKIGNRAERAPARGLHDREEHAPPAASLTAQLLAPSDQQGVLVSFGNDGVRNWSPVTRQRAPKGVHFCGAPWTSMD